MNEKEASSSQTAELARADPALWVDRHGDALFRFAMLRLRDQEAAEEVVQECFTAAISGQRAFAGDSGERTWLIGILKHKIADRFRGRRPAAMPIGDPEAFDDRGFWSIAPRRWKQNPADAIQQAEFREVLRTCIETLPGGLFEAYVLRDMDQIDGAEISQLLGITSANLWQRLHRARLALRRCLEINWFRPTRGGIKGSV